MRRAGAGAAAALLLAGCGASSALMTGTSRIPRSLLAGERPIGAGPRFQPPATGPLTAPCTATLGPREQAHIEVFGANRVVLLPAGMGTEPPRRFLDGRLLRAGCFGALVTVDPTGVVYFRPGTRLTLATLFRVWGQPLTARRVASFTGGRTAVYVGGRRWPGAPGSVPLRDGEEIVVEIGPHVPPHRSFTFAPKPSRRLP